MKTYFRKLGAGLAGILNFNGRMALRDFWPYAITVVLVLYGLGSVLGIWMQLEFAQRLGTGAWSGDAYDPELIERQAEQTLTLMKELFRFFVPYAAISLALHIIPLAAATVRRLHDTGRTGWWALIPLPFSAYGIYLLSNALSRVPELVVTRPADPVIFAFIIEIFTAIGVSLLWIAAVIVLIILLCGRSSPKGDRFGPPPVPI
ncbi:MAG: hypothetical protein B7Z41_04965 [Rhizobiales bacterium 12-66-7]|nr:MAG: hypothetical protein B7Z41_04965 [Rhizobiales bacterium 12-66-7]